MSCKPALNRVSRVLALSAALGFASLAGAQADKGAAPASAQMQQEREACLSGKSGQDQAACLREIGAARQESKRGGLETAQGQLERNRADRCKALTGADQADCYARIRGEGTVEGSVKGGGVIREKRTVVPAAPTTAGANSSGSGTSSGSTGTSGSGGSGASGGGLGAGVSSSTTTPASAPR